MAADTEVVARVLIVEDHAALGEALMFAFGFEEDVEVVGLAPTVAAAVEMAAASRPDVVLMDVNLPDGNGIDATAAVLEVHPGAAVIVLTAHADPTFALRAAEAGASGFVPKDVRMAKILAAVRAVMAGEPAMEPTVLHSVLVHAASGRDSATPPPALGADDIALLELLAQGIGSVGVAAKLGLDGAQAAARVAALVGRIGARSRLEAVVLAARMGLLDPTAA